jgi:hypothetical protein
MNNVWDEVSEGWFILRWKNNTRKEVFFHLAHDVPPGTINDLHEMNRVPETAHWRWDEESFSGRILVKNLTRDRAEEIYQLHLESDGPNGFRVLLPEESVTQ